MSFINKLLTIALLCSLTACDDPDAFAGDDLELAERSGDVLPPCIEVGSTRGGLWPISLLSGGAVVLLADAANPELGYAYLIRGGEVVSIRHGDRDTDFGGGQNYPVYPFDDDQWILTVDDVDDELVEATVTRASAGGNVYIKPPRPPGPHGEDPWRLSVQLVGLVNVGARIFF